MLAYFFFGALGLVVLGAAIWLSQRVRMWTVKSRRHDMGASEQAQREAEFATRNNLPFR